MTQAPDEEDLPMGTTRRRAFAISASAALALTFAAPVAAQDEAPDALQRILDKGLIVMSTDPLYPPQSFLDADGEIVGFDIDVGQAIADRLGVQFVPTPAPWPVVASGRWADRMDFSVGSMAITPERQESIDFTRPYRFDVAWAALRDGVEADSLEGLTVCVGEATTYYTWLNGELSLPVELGAFVTDPPQNVNVITRETDRMCADEWASGRADTDAWVAAFATIDQAVTEGLPVVPVGSALFGEPLAAAFDNSVEDNDSLVAAVDEIIGQLHEEGVLRELSEKWYKGVDLSVPPAE
jgi:polar amino acid transport system substrate-binding protein